MYHIQINRNIIKEVEDKPSKGLKIYTQLKTD